MPAARLVLEDGTVYEGESFGAAANAIGEVVFNTSLTGYQEIATDPSYRFQIVVMTYPHIGNYGIEAAVVQSVTALRPYPFDEQPETAKKRIAVYDFGVKRDILRQLVGQGCDVTVYPATTHASEILNQKFDGVLLSNGPGDPEPVTYAQENIRHLVGKVPLFGICLGHQLLGLALGGRTYKLKFGHR